MPPNKIKRNHTFLTGLYMAINAVKDAYLIMDGPDCAYKKVELFDKNHDYYSKNFDSEGKHKISSTITDVNHVIDDRTEQIVEMLKDVAEQSNAGAIFISSEPMVALTGIDYPLIASRASKEYNSVTKEPKLFIPIPYKSLDLDWIDGYSYVMETIAKHLNFSSEKKTKNKVAVVGFLFDRYEGDVIGNINEIQRMLSSLGLDVCSFWLSGSDFAELSNIEEAELIISLPYAGKTAEIISRKTGAEVIKLGLPFGLDGTKKWLLQIAEKTNSLEEANNFLDAEMKAVMPLLEWIIPAFFRLKTFSFVGDPFLCECMHLALSEIDMKPTYNVVFTTKSRLEEIGILKKYEDIPLFTELDDIVVDEIPDFFIGNSEGRRRIYNNGPYHIEPYTEIGFPSYGTHFFYIAPYMGITGFLIFLNRMINSLKPE